ncbi:endonuclease/exonuclease/phosphatase (EEP) superfamily protein YafD [Microbacterium halimionae]|uniref:Endonuclease/exonuclease/phosphatase (EEP) superfamily protein YafD n=1 Tax=Microbacterium halimionae TaxID=1526413 RepID=A0A7W3JQX2_9MICO|nr:endonuclease/exonuclease/phosphatase family protein [Microbacterium halimionae]MBA8817321.1 endonuclease/exonuclease/phosphatase (EEP) superfamily protein YafD [Microbacterium halimionae]NII95955.1 endonuclease/exonuclease/phosphatase (EEP) superfamily protein YafD [Microbacterium halimionae]
MLRLFGLLLTVLGAIAVAVISWPQFFRLERDLPIAQLVSFRALIAVGFAALFVLALFLAVVRPIRALALSLAFVFLAGAGVNGAILASRGLGSQTLPEQTETSVRVMTWNTAGVATSADTIAQTAVAMDADIVTLPETTIETGTAVAVSMGELGHPMWAHHTQSGEWDSESTTILISPDLGDYSVIESSADGTSNTSTLPSAVAMPNSGDGPIVVAAHAVAPREDYMPQWRGDLQWLADQCAGDANVIMAGDFNATVDHMSGLGVDGGDLGQCTDTAAATGNGAIGTWSTALPALAGAPIDHVMVSAHWTATGSVVLQSLDDAGSDHRPLVVQLEPYE